jgi:diaminopropionate ammonia-lyase
MKILINPHRKMNPVSFPVENIEDRIRDAVSLHRALPGYAPTPLIDLSTLSKEMGFRKLWIKDEGARFRLKAFKALGASYAVYSYLREMSGGTLEPKNFMRKGREIARDIVFTAATDGNHGRAVAWTARLLNKPAVIYMPAGSVPARIEAIKSEEAEVIVIDGSYDDAVRRASEDARRHGRIVIADTGYEGYMNIPLFIQQGYLTMFAEIREQLGETNGFIPDLVFIQSGVGAFAAAAAEFFSAFYPKTRLVSVEPVAADCLLKSAESTDGKTVSVSGQGNTIMAGLNCGTPSLTAWGAIRDHFFAFTAVEDSWAIEAMRTLARNGVVSGESGCAGLAAVLALKAEYPDFFGGGGNKPVRNVILISTEADTDPESYKKIVS